jgi:hypothetical protein
MPTTQREIPALPEMNGMSVAVSRQRNRRLCEWICEYPPTVTAVSQTALAFTTKNTKLSPSGLAGAGGSGALEQTIDLLIAKKIKNKLLITNRIEVFEVVTTKSSGFTTDCDEDIILKGCCGTEDKLFWNGSTSTLFIDGWIESRGPCITLNGSRIITEDDAGNYIGMVFNYWDETKAEADVGFWGFDPATKCFRYLLDLATLQNRECGSIECKITGGIPGDICTDNFIAQNLKNKAAQGEDLNILSTTNIQVTATEGIDNDSSTYTVQTTTGTIISNTGTEGIDILSSNGDIDITSTDAAMNVTTTNDNMTINVDTGDMEICVDDGDLKICVNGSTTGQDLILETTDKSCISMTSACDNAQAILINSTAGGIDITAEGAPGEDIDILNNEGSVNITGEEADDQAVCFFAPNGGICIDASTTVDIDATDITVDATNNVTVNVGDTYTVDAPTYNQTSDDVTITVTNDFTVNGAEKLFKRWFPYKTFDVSCGYWQTHRDEISGCGVYFWQKIAREETVYITIDIDNPLREDTDKGFQLDRIYFSYEVEDEELTSLTPCLTQKTWDDGSPGTAVSVSTIAFTDGNLVTSGLSIDEHYRYIDITSPDYLNTESVITMELKIVSKASSVFKFYGAMIHYTFDAL